MIPSAHRPAASPFHEWPLVVFTTLAVMGAGMLTTPLLAWAIAGTPAPAADAMPRGALLLGTGLLVSLAHLGRPLRAPLAPLGLGRSRLSAEIVCAGVALLCGAAAAIFHYVSPVLDIAAALAAVAFLVTLGLVYSLPGQLTWRGAVVWMPLSSGIGFGAVSLAGLWGDALVAVGAVAAVALAADTGLLILHRSVLVFPRGPLSPRYPALFARRQFVLAARFGLVDILPGICLLAGLPALAAGLLALGILIDRLAFYGLACPHTTEAEVEQVEGLLGN
jgi:DMSO reductase anchor subunit